MSATAVIDVPCAAAICWQNSVERGERVDTRLAEQEDELWAVGEELAAAEHIAAAVLLCSGKHCPRPPPRLRLPDISGVTCVCDTAAAGS